MAWRQPALAHHVLVHRLPHHPVSCTLAVRKRRGKTVVGREAEWEYLLGEAPTRWNPEQGLMRESTQNVGVYAVSALERLWSCQTAEGMPGDCAQARADGSQPF